MTLETTLVWDRWAGPREIPPQGYRAKGVERQPVKPGVSVGGQRGPKLNSLKPHSVVKILTFLSLPGFW